MGRAYRPLTKVELFGDPALPRRPREAESRGKVLTSGAWRDNRADQGHRQKLMPNGREARGPRQGRFGLRPAFGHGVITGFAVTKSYSDQRASP
jgi:hypothetical protein